MVRIAEIGKREAEGNCLVCSDKTKETRILHIRRKSGDSIISFNICKDCLLSLGVSLKAVVDEL